MWIYVQKTGELLRDGSHIVLGYSGFDDPETGQRGKNNPELERVEEVGPIPVGKYLIGTPHDTLTHGPYVLPLTPDPANEMFGRSAFLMHGDSVVDPGTASRGCIIILAKFIVDITTGQIERPDPWPFRFRHDLASHECAASASGQGFQTVTVPNPLWT